MFDVRSLFAALRPKTAAPGAYARGLEAFEAGRGEDALREFEAALAEANTDAAAGAGAARGPAPVHSKRGVVLIALGRRGEALAAFCEALAADERCAPALVNLGNVLFEDGHTEDAIDYYRAALRADERYAVAHRNLGVALKRLGRRGEAVRALRSAARLESRRPP